MEMDDGWISRYRYRYRYRYRSQLVTNSFTCLKSEEWCTSKYVRTYVRTYGRPVRSYKRYSAITRPGR